MSHRSLFRLIASNPNIHVSDPPLLISMPRSTNCLAVQQAVQSVVDDPGQWAAWLILVEKRPDQAEYVKRLVKDLARAAIESES